MATWTNIILQLIAEGSSKLASVPSGGAGGAAAGGAAAASGGAAAAEEKAEEKEEGMNHTCHRPHRFGILTCDSREGRVRRGHGLRSLRLSEHRTFLTATKSWIFGEVVRKWAVVVLHGIRRGRVCVWSTRESRYG